MLTNIYSQTLNSLLILLIASLIFVACSKNNQIPVELENQLRSTDVRDINSDFIYQSPDHTDKKYIALTVTYNFWTADGYTQKEYPGFILKLENGGWKVDHSTAYTKNSEKAKSLLEGKK